MVGYQGSRRCSGDRRRGCSGDRRRGYPTILKYIMINWWEFVAPKRLFGQRNREKQVVVPLYKYIIPSHFFKILYHSSITFIYTGMRIHNSCSMWVTSDKYILLLGRSLVRFGALVFTPWAEITDWSSLLLLLRKRFPESFKKIKNINIKIFSGVADPHSFHLDQQPWFFWSFRFFRCIQG